MDLPVGGDKVFASGLDYLAIFPLAFELIPGADVLKKDSVVWYQQFFFADISVVLVTAQKVFGSCEHCHVLQDLLHFLFLLFGFLFSLQHVG